jgi:hypothetical protein
VHPLIADVCHKLLQPKAEHRFGTGNQVIEELSPLFKAVYKRYPEIRRQFAKSPPALTPQLFQDEARIEVRHAQRLFEEGPDQARRAAIAAQRALALSPRFEEAEELLKELHRKHSFTTDEPDGGEWQTALSRLEEKREDKVALQTLAERARKKRNIFLWFGYLRRYVRQAPDDQKALSDLRDLAGRNPFAPFVKDQRVEEALAAAEIHDDDDDS